MLGVSAGPEVNEDDFLAQCKKAAGEKLNEAIEKLENKYKSKLTTAKNKIERQELKVEKYRKELSSRGFDTALKIGESLLNLATKGKLTGVSSSSTKARMAAESRSRLKEANMVLEDYQEELVSLQEQFKDDRLDIEQKWAEAPDEIRETKISATKQNIRITHFGILWKA